MIEATIAVVGAGPAGIAAATRAAESGADVLLLDEGPAPGGQIWRRRATREARHGARRWLARLERSGARINSGLEVILADNGGRDGFHRLVAEISREPGTRRDIRARTLILATGARERFLAFPGWTIPNVIGVGAAQSLLKSGAGFRGRRVVVSGTGPLLLPAAAALASGGARVEIVAEQASARSLGRFVRGLAGRPGKLFQAAAYRSRFLSARYRAGVWVTEARGEERVREVLLTDGARIWSRPCDLLCSGYGLVPNLEIPALLGCEVAAGRVPVDAFQRSSLPEVFCAGELTGIGGVGLALLEGEIAGLAAAGREAQARRLFPRRARGLAFAREMETAFALRPELRSLARPDTIVCRCEDVALGRIDPAWARRAAKLYTRAGMGPCQGRVCGAALDFLLGGEPDSVRPPLRPAPLSAFIRTSERERRSE